MCVLIIKPANVAMPDNEVINAAMTANPHGFGFATPDRVYKTLSRRAFKRALAAVRDSEPCIIHCRLATHGSVCQRNCHPFELNGLKFAHNGILDIRPIGDMTDSETAFRRILAPAAQAYGLDSPHFARVVDKIIGRSKFAFMQGDEIRIFGDFKMRRGCFFSNLNFERYYRLMLNYAV